MNHVNRRVVAKYVDRRVVVKYIHMGVVVKHFWQCFNQNVCGFHKWNFIINKMYFDVVFMQC